MITDVPLRTADAGEFFSPTENINCEIHYQGGVGGDAYNFTYCQTSTPPRSIEISTTGSVLRRCEGQQCLGNAGASTPTLSYGSATGVGPLRCVSLSIGVICTGSGVGFLIASGGVSACSGSTSTGELTICPGSAPVGARVTIVGKGCGAGFVVFLGPGSYNGSGGGGADIPVASGASNYFAGSWTIPSTYYSGGNVNTPLPVKPGSDYQFQTAANTCHASFQVTSGSG